MTVESNYAVAVATASDWLKNLALVFQPMRKKTKTNRTLRARSFPRALSKLQAIARNSGCFIALFAPAVIGRGNYFDIGFSTVS